jgi:hypothetical protein
LANLGVQSLAFDIQRRESDRDRNTHYFETINSAQKMILSITILIYIINIFTFVHCASKFWGEVLPLACHSSCEELKKEKPDLKYTTVADEEDDSVCIVI